MFVGMRRFVLMLCALGLGLALPAHAAGEERPDAGSSPYAYDAPSRRACGTSVCVHWVETTDDAPDLDDADGDTVPDRVEFVRDAFDDVWGIEVTADGFRAPVPDGTLGGDARTDVYLQNLSTFGTVVMDRPGATTSSAFVLLDDDFRDVIPGVEPTDELLDDPAAHEFFHVVQCAYDCLGDAMFDEGTAVWMSDRAWDGSSRDFEPTLYYTALRVPHRPLDGAVVITGPNEETSYASGSWLFWRWLAEELGPSGADPAIVRALWDEVAAGSTSVEAVEAVAAAHGTTFRRLFARFGAENVRPGRFYEDGAAYVDAFARAGWRMHPAVRAFTLGGSTRSTGARITTIDHLATRYVKLRPGDVGSGDALRVTVDGPPRAEGASVSVVIERRSGDVRIARVALDASGAGSATVERFARTRAVWLVLTNANAAYECDQGTGMPCGGVPLGDDRVFAYRARVR